MTLEENIFWAKRNIVDYIYKSANLEGITVTYPETSALYNGMTISRKMKVDDVVTINNLKYAWRFILEHIDYPIDYSFICKINQFVGGNSLIFGAGYIRTNHVSIGGTKWRPDIPVESQIKEELLELNTIENPTDRALSLMLYCMRKQMFIDGNKRTAMLAANHIMIQNGCGIISIPVEIQDEYFKPLLIKFYETGSNEEIKQFIYDNCIDGADFPKKEQSDKAEVKNKDGE
jgi:hypothetical protein